MQFCILDENLLFSSFLSSLIITSLLLDQIYPFLEIGRSINIKFILPTAQKMKFSIKDFCNKCDQIRSFLSIWSHLLKKSFMENFIFCSVTVNYVRFSYSNFPQTNTGFEPALTIILLQQYGITNQVGYTPPSYQSSCL